MMLKIELEFPPALKKYDSENLDYKLILHPHYLQFFTFYSSSILRLFKYPLHKPSTSPRVTVFSQIHLLQHPFKETILKHIERGRSLH